jgi:predicted metal-dependent phosphoesterase TrpH
MSTPEGWQLLDLHNHTYRSYDARNRLEDYERAHAAGRFDTLAITEHNRIDGALELAEGAGFEVIVGQEIDTAGGELIGLFLSDEIDRGLPIEETARAIRRQGGLVYLPHPFYRLIRHPVAAGTRAALADAGMIDVVEVANGGPFTTRANRRAREWALARDLPMAAGSDAHEPGDIGTCVCAVPPGPVTAAELPRLLRQGRIVVRRRNAALQIASKLRTRAAWALEGVSRGAARRR